MKAQLRARRAALRPADPRRKRLRFWLLLAIALLLLLLLRDCSCQTPEPPPGPPAPGAAPEPEPEPEPETDQPETPRARRKATGRLPHLQRPRFENQAMDPLPWLDDYRLQVAARSPRLAECFVGAPNPGTLEWTASVEPSLGRVSDQSLEPTLLSDALTRRQRACALAVLSEPPYQLESQGERATPARVSMVIEF
jgi:hypothetical protein